LNKTESANIKRLSKYERFKNGIAKTRRINEGSLYQIPAWNLTATHHQKKWPRCKWLN